MHAGSAMPAASEEAPARQEQAGDDDDEEEGPADESEGDYEVLPSPGIFPDVDPVVDDRRQRADKRAEPGGVGAVYQAGEILGKGI